MRVLVISTRKPGIARLCQVCENRRMDKTWGLSLGQANPAAAGPLHAFSRFPADVTVAVIEPSALPHLDSDGSREVTESKGAFTAEKLKGDGVNAVRHGGSGNT